MKTNIYGYNKEELKKTVKLYNEPEFRANQIYKWLYTPVKSFDEMTNISLKLRNRLNEDFYIYHMECIKMLEEEKSGTTKFLWKTEDGLLIESVLLKYDAGNSICISTQAGCRMGCVFCESGKDGLIRSLTKGEMISQIQMASVIKKIKISNIVLMGSGEPLDNYDEVISFIKLVNDRDSLNIGQRHITLSTCGVAKNIIKLMGENLNINLSISLHSPISELRKEIMPIERAYSLSELIPVCNEYRRQTGRRITYEYCLIPGKNDTDECVNELKKLFANSDSLINIIGINENDKNGKTSCSTGKLKDFAFKLEKCGLNVSIRRKLGSSINAACGQLKSGYLK